LNILDRFSKDTKIANFIKIYSVGADLLHADGRRTHNEANSRFSNSWERV